MAAPDMNFFNSQLMVATVLIGEVEFVVEPVEPPLVMGDEPDEDVEEDDKEEEGLIEDESEAELINGSVRPMSPL